MDAAYGRYVACAAAHFANKKERYKRNIERCGRRVGGVTNAVSVQAQQDVSVAWVSGIAIVSNSDSGVLCAASIIA